MNAYSERFARTVTVAVAIVLVITWSVITFAEAYTQSLADINDSYNRSLSSVYLLDEVISAIERLSIEQRAFLSTADPRFVDGVWTSIVSLDRNLEMLKGLAVHGALQQAPVAQLSTAVRRVENSVAHSDDIRDRRGKRAAIAFFDADEAAISAAQSQAGELKSAIVLDLYRSLHARGSNRLLQAVFHGAPAGVAFGLRPRDRGSLW
jgi:hypothetical protein